MISQGLLNIIIFKNNCVLISSTGAGTFCNAVLSLISFNSKSSKLVEYACADTSDLLIRFLFMSRGLEHPSKFVESNSNKLYFVIALVFHVEF